MSERDAIYREVINILEHLPSIKYKELIFEIAREYPDSIIGAYENIDSGLSVIDAKLKEILEAPSGGKIKAIRWLREETGEGLKEAKEYVESFIATHGVEISRIPYEKTLRPGLPGTGKSEITEETFDTWG